MLVLLLILAAAGNVAGGAVYLFNPRWDARIMRWIIGAGSGFLLAVVFFVMLPEAVASAPAYLGWTLAGYLIVHFFQQVLTPHFHYGEERHADLPRGVLVSATVGLAVHSLLDGVAIGVAVAESTELGWLVFLGAFWHKFPTGFTLASINNAHGGTARLGVWVTVMVGAATVAGGLAFHLIATSAMMAPALALSAGSLLYVGASDLMPEVNKHHGVSTALAVFVGVVAFFLVHLVVDAAMVGGHAHG